MVHDSSTDKNKSGAKSSPRIAIIGAGAAGLSAGLVAARNGISVRIFESKNAGGRVGGIPYIDSYPGLGRMKGTDFMKSLKKQIEEFTNVKLHELETVKEIKLENEFFTLVTRNGEYNFEYVILAMGAEHKRLDVTGEMDFKGRGVSYCAACDGLFFKNKNTVVIGNDTHALEQALFLNELGSYVTLVNPESCWCAEQKLCDDLSATQIKVMKQSKVEEIYGERLVAGISVSGTEEGVKKIELAVNGIFISVGLAPRNDLIKELGVELTNDGYVKIDEQFQTNIPGLHAIGDLVVSELEVVSLCATGANAVRSILSGI